MTSGANCLKFLQVILGLGLYRSRGKENGNCYIVVVFSSSAVSIENMALRLRPHSREVPRVHQVQELAASCLVKRCTVVWWFIVVGIIMTVRVTAIVLELFVLTIVPSWL